MKLDFRIDFGYQYLYSRKHYHPVFLWDGELTCKNGKIEELYKLDYPYIWYGPGHCPTETPMEKAEWSFKTKREFTGIRVVAEVNADTVFHLRTASADLSFTANEIENDGRLDFSVGPKYLACSVIVTKKDYLWFRRPLREGEVAYESDMIGVQTHEFARMKLGFIDPGCSAKWEHEIPASKKDFSETLFHIVAMAAPRFSGGKEEQVEGYIPMELYCDGELIHSFKRYFRFHDDFMQILEDVWERVCIVPGKHVFELKNCHTEFCLAVSRIVLKQCERDHGELSVPEWALVGEKLVGKVFATHKDTLEIKELGISVKCDAGWNEFNFSLEKAGVNQLSTTYHTAKIEIFDVKEESRPVKVGYDMTTVPHDNTGFMDWLLDYTARTRLGNYIVFRTFKDGVEEEEWTRYGEFCKTHGIYVSSCSPESYEGLVKSSGDMFNDCGTHEYSGKVYAWDPAESTQSETMKEATEKLTDYFKVLVDEIHGVAPRAALGDASGAIRHSFIAGVDFVRAETMVAHTMTLLSQARPASEALGEGSWGVHIAIQHMQQPYHEFHLGQYFLSMMQPWVMGAEVIYEEDSLFALFKEERQTWDDLLTGGKRDMTRAFFKFAKTHPRTGKNVRNIAYLEGRYAAPFNGFICDSEQDPHYSVFGAFGKKDEAWGHRQPEKARQVLDVLMPGASTQPLRQKFDKRRFFFSGTPYGDFDCAPIEASVDYLKNYKLILNLGWNTAIDEDTQKLTEFVRDGGILLTGLPQLSTHIRREFLLDMDDLALIDNEKIAALCGIEVLGKGEKYSGYWNSEKRASISEPELSALPNDRADEDGDAYIANVVLNGAEVVAWDYYTGKPMLVRYALGKGYVYTFTAWGYPGHEKLQCFSAAWVQALSDMVNTDVRVEDASKEVFWSVWKEGENKTVMLLNTDWAVKGNEKPIKVIIDGVTTELAVKEREITMVKYEGGKITVEKYEL